MDQIATQCPYCAEAITIEVDDESEGAMVQDCEVCCRPLQIFVTRNGDGEIEVTVDRVQ